MGKLHGSFDAVAGSGRSPILFQSLILTTPDSQPGRQGTTFVISFAVHSALVLAAVVVPLLVHETLPGQEPREGFFPPLIAPAPPLPPPPPARTSAQLAPRAELRPRQAIVMPLDVPTLLRLEDAPGFGVADVATDGVDGGVPDGVPGSVLGALPTVAPPPPPRVVRIQNHIAQPKLIRRVDPIYPELGIRARIGARVLLEAEVDALGYVKSVKVLSGHPLFDEPAMQAVRQWRYQPLLLNGAPTGFILSVTVTFNLKSS